MLDPRVVLETLLELTRELRCDHPLEGSLRDVTHAALRLLRANHASVRLLDETGTKLLAAVRSGAGSDRRPLDFRRSEGAIGWVVEHGQALRLDDVRNDARFERKFASQGFIIGSMVAVPMWSGGKVIGVLSGSS
ncbi:MAG: GAF domain-containing protein, partial [Polyangiaceae bacterium]|nr:GAF domain-containing protein [Polyangiaceae bacterium]